jgi:hypothetical protein
MRVLVPALTFSLLCAGSSCEGPPSEGEGEGEGEEFPDHTVRSLDTVEDYEAIAEDGPSSTALKFVITRFLTADENVRFLASDFYILHDEWWWFRLMNGARIDGVNVAPVDVGRSFDTVQDIVSWARARPADTLPLDLTWVQDGSRLYSPMFYQLALQVSPKVLGIGTVLHFPARPNVDPPLSEQWAIELEYSHVLDETEMQHLLDVVEAALPSEIGDRSKRRSRNSSRTRAPRWQRGSCATATSPCRARPRCTRRD